MGEGEKEVRDIQYRAFRFEMALDAILATVNESGDPLVRLGAVRAIANSAIEGKV